MTKSKVRDLSEKKQDRIGLAILVLEDFHANQLDRQEQQMMAAESGGVLRELYQDGGGLTYSCVMTSQQAEDSRGESNTNIIIMTQILYHYLYLITA